MSDEQAVETEEEPQADDQAAADEPALTQEEQQWYDEHVAELRAEWETQYREQLREELRGELEGEAAVNRLIEEHQAMKAELESIKGKKPKLSADPNASRGDARSQGDGVLRVTMAQLNDLDWMSRHQGQIAKASAEGGCGFEIVDLT